MTLKDDIIHRLQDEVIFLQKTDIEITKNYSYKLNGNLSETRNV